MWEADTLITLAKRGNLKFTIGYSQRFNPKIAYAKKKITDGTLGKPVSVMVSRHLSRSLGKKIASRVRLSPAVNGIHPRSRFRVLDAGAGKAGARLLAGCLRLHAAGQRLVRRDVDDGDHGQWRGGRARRRLELAAQLSEFLLDLDRDHRHRGLHWFLDDTHRDNWLNTVSEGTRFPMSTMPGEQVDEVFAGQMGPETIHFLEACMRNSAVMVTPERRAW